MSEDVKPRTMKIFFIIWLGQLVSLIGSGLTSFALGVWVYQLTGSVTQFALAFLFTTLPAILISPVVGITLSSQTRPYASEKRARKALQS